MTTVLYVGTDEGVKTLRKNDDGSFALADAQMPEWAIEALAVVPSNPNVVLAGTRGDGVWLSEDAGTTFTKPNRGKPGPQKIMSLAIDPSNENRVYAGCEPIDLYVSEDLGKNWQRIESVWDVPFVATVPYPNKNVEPHVRDIAIDPDDPKTIYIALQVGFILKTTDGAKTWKLLDNGLDPDVHQFAMDPNDPKHILISTGGDGARRGVTNGGKSVFSTTDGGETWTPRATNFHQTYGKQLLVKPNQPEVAFTALAIANQGRWKSNEGGAEGVLIRTKDGGENWEEINMSSIPGADQDLVVAFTADPEDADTLYGAFMNGELISSTDGGDTWAKMDIQVPGLNEIEAVSV